MLWSEASLAQYDESRDKVRWEQDVPEGAVFHVAWMGDDGLHVVDVWESEAAFNTFAENRLMKVVVFDLAEDRAVELAKTIGDAANEEDAEAAIDTAKSLGVLSVVANVAGGGVGGGRTISRDGVPAALESFVKTLEMNAVATFNMTRLASGCHCRVAASDQAELHE